MAEKSLYWFTDGFTGDVGDGAAPYTQTEQREWHQTWAGEGVYSGIDNELEVTGVASPLSVDTGRAQVAGFHYWSDSSVSATVTTPVVGDTGGRIVLQANWKGVGGAALEARVRVFVLLNTDGVAAIPALTQTLLTTYEISLCSFVIDTGGVIYTDASKGTTGVTDTRQFAISPLAGMVKLREFNGDGTTGTVTFDGIQQNLHALKLVGWGRTDGAVGLSENLLMRFNNDSGANYTQVSLGFENGSTSPIGAPGFTSLSGTIILPNSNSAASFSDPVDVLIHNYANTTFYKTVRARSAGIFDNTALNIGAAVVNGWWEDTSGITRIDLISSSGGNLITGTKIILYGLRS